VATNNNKLEEIPASRKSTDGPAYTSPCQFSLANKLGVNIANNDFHFPQIIGHRGALFTAPESTLASFDAAANMGCDGVELDVFRLKCGTLVVFHGDGTDEDPGYLRSYCGVDGNILDYTYKEMKHDLTLDPYGNGFACPIHTFQDDNIFIPTLAQVLAFAKQDHINLHVKIELKGPGTAEPCLELVEAMHMVDQCSFSSFFHDRIQRIRQLRPQRRTLSGGNGNGAFVYQTGALFNEPPTDFILQSLKLGASEVHLKYDTCSMERVSAIHETGLNSMAWFRGYEGMQQDAATKYFDVGNEDESMYDVVRKSGVQAMCINRPGSLAQMRNSAMMRQEESLLA
jgi:glycerophosphoryl diester phosphodiesterase